MDTNSACINSGLKPMQLPITRNAVSSGGVAGTRGIALTIGDPQQLFSFRPTTQQNNTFVTNLQQCVTKSNYSCVAEHGGVFDTTGAHFVNSEGSWNGTPGEATPGLSIVYFNDIFRIAGANVPGVPFFTYTNQDTLDSNPSALSLGQESSFLKSMVDNKIIATKKWSYWPGTLGINADSDKDGLLILGGYDAGLAGSDFTAMPMDYANGVVLNVEITGLSWQNSTSTLNMMPSGYTKLQGYIDLYTNSIANLPKTSALQFAVATGAQGNETYGWRWPSMPSGNMIVTLSNGMKTTIPASDIFRNPQNYSSNGLLQPTATRVTSFAWYDTENPWPYRPWIRLGYPFLAQHLLVADPDKQQFYLADAVKAKGSGSAGNLQALCKDTATNKTTPTPTPSPGKSHTGAIAGGVGGGIGALLLFALLFFFYRRHMKKSRAQAQAKNPGNQEHGPAQPTMSQAPQVAEQPDRTSMASPPPKYMQAGVYEQPQSPPHQYQPYQDNRYSQATYTNELASNPPMSPRSEAGQSQATTAMGGSQFDRYSQVGTHLSGVSHEMTGDHTFSATSGPIEMPADSSFRR